MFGLLGRRALVGETFGPGETVPRIVLSFQFGSAASAAILRSSAVQSPSSAVPSHDRGRHAGGFFVPVSIDARSERVHARPPARHLDPASQADARYNDPAGQPARTLHYLGVIGRLNAGATAGRARADLAAIAKGARAGSPTRIKAGASPSRSLHEQTVGGVQPALLVLLGGVGIVLSSRASTSRTCCSRAPPGGSTIWRFDWRSARPGVA